MFRAGSQIGQYTLVRKLGKGGFGEVWLAEKSSQFFTKRVAVKLPHDEQIDFETIRREATLWEEASGHPNVLPIIDADVYEGQVIIVSEYADGGSLADKLKTEGKFSPAQAVEMTAGILNGLEFLHNKKIIHRDIKPQNVLLQGDTPRLADFGISRAMHTSTISSIVIGTDAYMSPEAFDGKRNVQTDIWSVGVVLYQLLKGSLPFPQEHPSERMYAVLTKQFEPLPDAVPAEIKEILQKALAKLPENRFQSAAEMREALRHSLTDSLPQTRQTIAPTAVISPPISQPTIQPNHFAPQATGNQSIVTKFAVVPPVTETPVVNPTATQTFNTNRRADIKKAAVTSAIGVALAILLLFGAVAGFLSLRRDSSNTPSSGTLSNSASVADSDSANAADATGNRHPTINSAIDYSSTNSVTGDKSDQIAANTITLSNSSPVDSTNAANANAKNKMAELPDRTSGTADADRPSNPNSSNPSRADKPEFSKTGRSDDAEIFEPHNNDDDSQIRVLRPTRDRDDDSSTTMTETRRSDSGKMTSPANVRRGEIPPEVYEEMMRNIKKKYPNANITTVRRP